MTNTSDLDSGDSKLTEFETLVRFTCLVAERSDIEIDALDIPTNKENESEEKFVSMVSNNSSLSESEVRKMLDSSNGPDIVGTRSNKPLNGEAKGGKKLPNNAEKELSYVLMKNIKFGEPMESCLVIPLDRAIKFRNRLTNKNEGMKDKAGIDGYIKGMEAMEGSLDNVNYRMYLVWNDVIEFGLREFFESEYEKISEKRKEMPELKPISDI